MTKSTITRERLEEIRDCCWMDDLGLSMYELSELASMALAAMDSEPVAWTDEEELRDVNVAGIGYLFGIDREANKFADPRRQIMLYRHAPASQVVPEEIKRNPETGWYVGPDGKNWSALQANSWNACRSAMLQASPVCTCPSGDGSLRWPCPVHAGSSPVIQDGYVLVPKEATLDMLKAGAKQEMKGEAFQYVWQAMLAAAPQEVMKDEANNLSPK